MSDSRNILIQDYTYNLPDDRIALHPLAERDQSKLLVYEHGKITHSNFFRLADFIPDNSILFLNNTKVIPARLFFKKDTGALIAIFLLNPIRP
ncbi:MAG TPA: S-adenosylmethionine tRNA ribosyltransferase, partial [Cytophagales bacterium]|nr:S-adenosylmethionine tRNA ribosyltransferase [Cytophagales bacterium]